MQQMDIKEKLISTGHFQFIFPVTLKGNSTKNLALYLQNQNFSVFKLDDIQKETAYYGGYSVSHSDIEAFFLPITNTILFPQSLHQKGLHRYTKELNLKANLAEKNKQLPFQIHSIDVIICPYQLVFLTIRSEMNNVSFSEVIEFANYFRLLEKTNKKEDNFEIYFGESVFSKVRDFIFTSILPDFRTFIDKDAPSLLAQNKMFVTSFLSFENGQLIENADLYRAVRLCGHKTTGTSFVQPNNQEYIKEYIKDNSFSCWAPAAYTIFDEQCFSCITSEDQTVELISHFYGSFYYAILVNFFHRLVFLKIAATYASINIDRSAQEFQKLNYMINSFTSNYFFNVHPSDPIGKDLFKQIKKCFQINHLHSNTKETLFSVFKYEENKITKRDSLLLLILTLYTVICGIFSMNLFAEDLKGNIHWDHFKSYNLFEYFAVFIVFSGILTVWYLGLQSLYQWIQERKYRKKWVHEFVTTLKNDKLH